MKTRDDITLIREWLGTGSINIFGLPFAGKDTHGKVLAEQLGGTLLGGGEILRNSRLSESAKRTTERGHLTPSEEYINLVLPYLSKPEFSHSPLILSAVGRWHGEEKQVIEVTKASHHPLKVVLYLKIDPLVAYERWQQSQLKKDRALRSDDDESKLEIRFNEFMSKTLPVIEEYRKLGLLVEIDGIPKVDIVNEAIITALLERSRN